MLVREAKLDDAGHIIEYIHRLDAEPYSMLPRAPGEFQVTVEQERTLLSDSLAADNALYLVAEIDGDIVGILNCEGGKRQATRHSASFGMSVASEHRNHGIGTALLSHLIAWAKTTGVLSRLGLEVYAHNAPAIHLYHKFDFVEEGRRHNAYFQHGQFIDGLLMARIL